MRVYNVTIPDHLMEHFERYHKHFLEYCETRTLEQTISVLLKYIVGNTKKISLHEIVMIEEFFDRSEHLFSEFLECVFTTGYEPQEFNP